MCYIYGHVASEGPSRANFAALVLHRHEIMFHSCIVNVRYFLGVEPVLCLLLGLCKQDAWPPIEPEVCVWSVQNRVLIWHCL